MIVLERFHIPKTGRGIFLVRGRRRGRCVSRGRRYGDDLSDERHCVRLGTGVHYAD